jgi:hypothetical protein
MLRLIRASKSRPSGTWSDDDYEVFDGEQHIGRIVWSYAAPRERLWVWPITCRFPQSAADRGSTVSREAAMAEFMPNAQDYYAAARVTANPALRAH